MKTDLRNNPPEPLSGRQQAIAAQTLVYIIFGFVGANVALALTVAEIAATRRLRHPPPLPPSPLLLGIFYALGLLCLAASALWARSRAGRALASDGMEFQGQIMIALALANVCEYPGAIWVFVGGAFPLSVPLFAGPALVTLGFLLPMTQKRAALLKQRQR